jgi:hypothetical protein
MPKAKERVDCIPPDGWLSQLRALFGISDSATWSDILSELAQTQRLAQRAARAYIAKQSRPEAKPYTVAVEDEGCDRCGHGRMWTIVGPDGYGFGQSWGDRETVEDLADYLNEAYEAGQALGVDGGQIEQPGTAVPSKP